MVQGNAEDKPGKGRAHALQMGKVRSRGMICLKHSDQYRKTFQESWNTRNLRRRVSDVEQLIDGKDKDRPNETKNPSVKSR